MAIGERIGRTATGGTVLALRGGLGAGKTTLTKGIAKGLGIEEVVTSPTYTIISEYEGRLRLHHIDAWRLGGVEDFFGIGGDEILADAEGLTVIEWSERIEEALPKTVVVLALEPLEGEARSMRLSGPYDEAWLP